LADMTAIGFTPPLFIMFGAYLFFREPMRWERWLAAGIGFCGVMIVVGPRLSGSAGVYNLVMLASAPMFAASFLITKALTRYETTGVILVWQALTVSIFSLPLALVNWQAPRRGSGWFRCSACWQCGALPPHAVIPRRRHPATQSVKFLDLAWAALLGWLVFADVPTQTTLIGGAVICAATICRGGIGAGARAPRQEPVAS
jgi:drug/metabolite transporter (DMT)-like permease